MDVGFLSGVWQETYITNLRIKQVVWMVDFSLESDRKPINLRINLRCGWWISLWSLAGNLYNKPDDKAVVWMVDFSLESGRKPI